MVDGEDNPRVQLFDTEGNFKTQFGQPGSGAGELVTPEHVNVDTKGSVYVVDRGDQTMKEFKQCPVSVSSWSEESGLVTPEHDDSSIPLKDLIIYSDLTIKIKVQPPKSLSFNGPLSLKDLLNPQQKEEANYNSSQVHEQE